MITGYPHAVLICRDTDASRESYERAGFRNLRGYQGL